MLDDVITTLLCLFYSGLVGIRMFIMVLIKGKDYFDLKEHQCPQNDKFCNEMDGFEHVMKDIKSRGIKLHYVAKGDRSKPMMLFIHGFPDFWYSWRHQMNHFSKDYWTVAVDQRGYGESDKPDGISSYKAVELIEDMKELILSLGKEKAIVVGHDWGGFVSWSLAIRYPELVERLIVFNCPHPGAFRSQIQKSWSQFLASWYMFFFQMRCLPEMYFRQNNLEVYDKIFAYSKKKGFTNDDDIQFYKYTWSQPKTITSAINYYRANLSTSDNKGLTARAPNIQIPTMLLWGEKDPYLTLQTATDSVKYVDKLQLRLHPKTGHWLHIEDLDYVFKNMDEFLHSE